MTAEAPEPATIRSVAPENAEIELSVLEKLYAEVYAEPPYLEGPADVAAFAKSWPYYVSQHGFSLAIAEVGETPVGFAFGFQLPVDTNWWSPERFLDPIDEADSHESEGRTFVIIELAVRLAYRRQGIGGSLHDAVLAGRPEERATLTVRPEVGDVVAMYESWSYRTIGRLRPSADQPIYLSMVRQPLGHRRTRSSHRAVTHTKECI